MSYKIFIPTAGLGSRLQKATKYINKSLITVDFKPAISHIIDKFSKKNSQIYKPAPNILLDIHLATPTESPRSQSQEAQQKELPSRQLRNSQIDWGALSTDMNAIVEFSHIPLQLLLNKLPEYHFGQ